MKIIAYIVMLRPHQWLKNLIIIFPPFLGGDLLLPGMIQRGGGPFLSFCMASSATYIFNDLRDRDVDVIHPMKKSRPIASGVVSTPIASIIMIILMLLSSGLALIISTRFLCLLVLYILLSLLYSLKLKRVPVVDIFCISAGFLIRLMAGGEVFRITISDWLFLSVFLLSLFLSTGKRLHEKQMLGILASGHRKALSEYPNGFLDGVMYLTGGAVLVTYTMYVISRHSLIYTVPVCCFGLLRFICRVQSGAGGDPTESLLHDRQLLVVGIVWTIMMGWGIYGHFG